MENTIHNSSHTAAGSPIDFSTRIALLTQRFVGREWLLKAVDVFLQAKKERYFVLTGEPGIGKSAFAAYLTQVRTIHASHFCIARQSHTFNPRLFVESVCAQLLKHLDGFQIDGLVQQNVSANIRIDTVQGNASVVGVNIEHLHLDGADAYTMFDRLITMPLQKWSKAHPAQSAVILVDGLDEANRFAQYPGISDLIRAAEGLPAAQVRWILTSRPNNHVDLFTREPVQIRKDSADNADDIRLYIDQALEDIPLATRADGVANKTSVLKKALAERADGNFLYLSFVFDRMRNASAENDYLFYPEKLPDGLEDVYAEFIDRIVGRQYLSVWEQGLFPVVRALTVAYEALTFDQLVFLSELSDQEVNRALVWIKEFLDPQLAREHRYSIFHTSFSDFLTDRDLSRAYWIDSKASHASIADLYLQHNRENWRGCDGYGLRFLPLHLSNGANPRSLIEVLSSYDYIRARAESGDIIALCQDYELMPNEPAMATMKSVLQMSQHVLMNDPTQLPSQLRGRLLSGLDDTSDAILRSVDELTDRNWLRPHRRCLMPPIGPAVMKLEGHTHAVSRVAVTSDGTRAVSVSADKSLRVWDLETGRPTSIILGEPDSSGFCRVAITSDGARVVTGSLDGTIQVWDLETRRLVNASNAHKTLISRIVLTPDEARAVSASGDTTLRVWDLETGETLQTLAGHTQPVTDVAVTPKGNWAVSASGDTTLRVWDLETGQAVHTLVGHSQAVRAVAVISDGGDGSRAVSASDDGTLRVWDLEKGRELLTLAGHSNKVTGVGVTSDGMRIISSSSDSSLKCWDIESGALVYDLQGHTRPVTAQCIALDGRQVVSASYDTTLRVWDLEKGRAVQTLAGHTLAVTDVAVTSDGARAVSASADKSLRVWDLGRKDGKFTISEHTKGINSLAIVPKGGKIVSASGDTTLRVWNLETGRAVQTLAGHTQAVRAVAVTGDGGRVVSASDDGTVRVWDLEKGRALRTLVGHGGEVSAVAMTPDGARAVSASTDTTLRVWNIDTGMTNRVLTGHSTRVTSVIITPDGQRAVSASSDRTLRVWDLASGQTIRTLVGHSGFVNLVAITPNGKLAVSAAYDHTLLVWDLVTLKLLDTWNHFPFYVRAIAFTPDGRRMLLGNHDTQFQIWDFDKKTKLYTFTADGSLNSCVAITGDSYVAGDSHGRMLFLSREGQDSS